MRPTSISPNMPAMSISVMGSPARSEMTGIGAVRTSMIGWMGSVML
jgi:hypothetical protein